MRHELVWFAGLLVVTWMSAAAAQEMLRVSPPDQQPPDVRLGKLRDYNTTTDWGPVAGSKEQWEKQAQQIREQILVATGLWPLPEKTPLNAVIHGKVDREDYTIEKVYFASMPGHYVSGNLYRPKAPPKGGKYPAILCPHGHWPEGRFHQAKPAEVKKAMESGAEKWPQGANHPVQARMAGLARLGCIVFHYDMVGYADSKVVDHRNDFLDPQAELQLQNVMGLQTWNSIRSLDFVLSLPEVDPQRIGVTGASGGGTQTMILGAIDLRPAALFPAVMVSMNMQGGCICENTSLLRVGLNNVAFAACAAPRPQSMTGADDWTNDIESKGLPQLKEVYGLFDAPDRVTAYYRPFPHNYNQVSRELMYNFFNQYLKLGHSGTVEEKPFVPAAISEMTVWDAQHPVPADASVSKLRESWQQLSDSALKRLLSSDRERYRAVLASALRAMVHDRWPVSARTVENSQKQKQGKEVSMETGLLTRADESTAMPYLLLTPRQWNQKTVIWAHPGGKRSMVDKSGKPVAAAQRLLDKSFAVLGADLFGTGEYLAQGQVAAALRPVGQAHPSDKEKRAFAGYLYGYNRSLLGERVHDLLTLAAYARERQSKTVHQVAWDGAGVWGLLAKALAGEAFERSALDVAGFDFDQLKSFSDENFLPGAVKYGGIAGFGSLCRGGQTFIYRGAGGSELAAEVVRGGEGPMERAILGD